ncbi:MAG: hypothetical protein ACRCUE_10370 [Bosea sp. (in: a-proteobacteria)]
MSFGVREPKRVAQVLAELMGATTVQAPTPPFPFGAWFVVAGDAQGSLLEILPAASVFDPDAPLAFRQRPPTFEPVSAHVLVNAASDRAAIQAAAAREGWRTQEVETGLFKVLKVWIDGNVLVEFLTTGEAKRYAEAFGAVGLPLLDGRLRDLEAKMAAALSQKLSPQMLEDALGRTAA